MSMMPTPRDTNPLDVLFNVLSFMDAAMLGDTVAFTGAYDEQELLYMISKMDTDEIRRTLMHVLERAVESGAGEVIDYLLSSLQLDSRESSLVLNLALVGVPPSAVAIEQSSELFEFVLSYVPISDLTETDALALAVSCSEPLHTNPDLAQTVIKSPMFTVSRDVRDGDDERDTNALVQHVDLSSVSIEMLRVLAWGLHNSTRDAISGYIIGCSMGGGYASLAELGQELENDTSPTGLLLRVVVLRRPDAVDLADWLVHRDSDDYTEAARDTLLGRQSRPAIAPIQGLVLCMLYPNLNLRDLGPVDVKTGKLVGAYLGMRALSR